MKEIDLITRNSKYYVIWTTWIKLIWQKKMLWLQIINIFLVTPFHCFTLKSIIQRLTWKPFGPI